VTTATSSVDAEEIERFEAVAPDWWDTKGPFRPLHKLNPARLAFLRDTIAAHSGRDALGPRPLDGLAVLDIGCGGGLISEPMARLGGNVTGIDPSAINIGVAAAHAEATGVTVDYRATTVEELADNAARFDVVLNLEVVEHVADVQLYLNAAARVLKPGGVMICSTLNRTMKSLALAKIGAEYLLRWLPAGTHDWRKFLTPAELAGHLRRAGLSITSTAGLTYNPLRDTWSVTDDTSVNYFMVAEKPAG
jgi:2-polyprenyl-6-hydroxyphenyl methylase/3-demethylubiquinone-9 3-methyltransferase